MSTTQSDDDFSHIPNVVFLTRKELKPSRVLIGLLIGVVIISIPLLLSSLITNVFLPKATPVPSVEIKKASPSATATPSAQKSETAGWKVYADKNITFKYPANWKRFDSNTNPIIISEKDPSSTPGQLMSPKVEVQDVSNKPLNSSYGHIIPEINELLNSKVGATWDSGAKHFEKLKNLKVGNREAVWVRQTINPNIPASGPAVDAVYVQGGTNVYQISIWDDTESELNQSTDTFNLILSTFRFD
ncbi:MAG: hypothetical protein A2Z11_00960 [Candidatus Woykebacteria bacterium RBG_16_43_9]|uniref:Uncharacterized protein n=1 Tax=Candidatus Woykebacteria bacterium RBG_16_43_9 TaxID=1802596 RepID=A0A1G1WH81_9BACT|nr:MAG: hypothetical protein A2Z11_00960 [Candidatus Woykebacteria bacterium RBG_16_43_9]